MVNDYNLIWQEKTIETQKTYNETNKKNKQNNKSCNKLGRQTLH